jgi:hypothetical protein
LNLSKPLFCQECKDEGKYIVHIAFFVDVDGNQSPPIDDSLWGWAILDHDGRTKQEWPGKFVSHQAAKDHLNGLVGYME